MLLGHCNNRRVYRQYDRCIQCYSVCSFSAMKARRCFGCARSQRSNLQFNHQYVRQQQYAESIPRVTSNKSDRDLAKIDESVVNHVIECCNNPRSNGGWLGMPYEENGCVKFLKLVFAEMGIDTGEDFSFFRDARKFRKVAKPEFGDVAVFKEPPTDKVAWHVAMMIDYRRAIQCAQSTNGVGKIDLTRYPWSDTLKGFYRLKEGSIGSGAQSIPDKAARIVAAWSSSKKAAFTQRTGLKI